MAIAGAPHSSPGHTNTAITIATITTTTILSRCRLPAPSSAFLSPCTRTQVSVKILASGKAPDMTPALGILVAMTGENPVQRGVMLDAKPAPLPNVLSALGDESASLRAVACGEQQGRQGARAASGVWSSGAVEWSGAGQHGVWGSEEHTVRTGVGLWGQWGLRSTCGLVGLPNCSADNIAFALHARSAAAGGFAGVGLAAAAVAAHARGLGLDAAGGVPGPDGEGGGARGC